MKMYRQLSNHGGFTLLELLIALALLTIGIFPVITMQVTAIKANSVANRISAANALSQEVMDDIMSWDISDPNVNATTADTVYDLNGPNVAGTDIAVTGAGNFRATYSTTIDTPVSGTTQVVVNIFKVTNGVSDPTPLATLTGCKRIT
jgi:prepilin-type N-terminal cleavage/methylation domain-containing protein